MLNYVDYGNLIIYRLGILCLKLIMSYLFFIKDRLLFFKLKFFVIGLMVCVIEGLGLGLMIG